MKLPTIDLSRVSRIRARVFQRVSSSVDKEIGSRYKFGDTCTESERVKERERERERDRVRRRERERERRNYKERG